MGYKKCPRCNINYIPDSEEYCPVCKEEIGYRPPAETSGLEYIYEYINRIFDDFRRYLSENDTLCELKSITFESGCLPQYDNVHIQQLYLLRYAYAYAYEYKSMYKTLFQNYAVGKNIAVTSVGCGNMMDYWALVQVLTETGNRDCVVRYTGIDVIDWQYKVKVRAQDFVGFKQTDAIEYLGNEAGLNSDIYFFPKTISEFSGSEFAELCDIFQNKPILKDKFCMLVSIRPVDVWGGTDISRVTRLVNAILSNGFYTENAADEYYNDDYSEMSNGDFHYPNEAVEELKTLTDRCAVKDVEAAGCKKCGKINRSPILTARYVQYQLFTFHREQK